MQESPVQFSATAIVSSSKEHYSHCQLYEWRPDISRARGDASADAIATCMRTYS